MSKELRPLYYYYIRRKWFSQLILSCSEYIERKGKDPFTLFWRAFGMGMTGDIDGCLREYDAFHARKDLQFPVNLAMVYFHKKAANVDREALRSITSELPLAEDVAKEAGLVLAARFQLLVGNFYEGKRLARKVLDAGRGGLDSGTASVFESEAAMIEMWCTLEEGMLTASGVSDLRRTVGTVIDSRNRIGADQDVDGLMLLAKAKLALDLDYEALAFLNLAISKFPAFTPALCEKALLLASSNDWEQALDCAQRLLDGDDEHLDGLLIIAVHAYTQEGLSHDAVQKLEDIDNALKKKEASSVVLAVQIASLFARICGRHPRTLQLCARLLERSLRAASMSHSLPAEVEAKVLCVLGEVYLRMGRAQLEKALAVLREATKRDATNLRVLLTLIHAQLVEGAVEDAEAQVELLSLMHSNLDELGHEILYLQALILRQKRVLMAQQQQSNSSHSSSIHGNEEERQREELLLRCKHLFLQAQSSSLLSALQMNSDSETNASLLDPDVSFLPTHFSTLYRRDPDFALLLSQEFFSMMESTALGASLVPSAAPSAGLLSANTLSNGPDADPSAPPPPSQRYTNHLTTLGNGRQTMAMVAPMHVHHHSSPSQQQPRGGFGQGVATALTLGDVTATLNTLSLVGSSIGQSSTVGGGASSSVASTMGTSSEASRETLEAMQHGLDLLTPLLSLCPGILPVYIESARAYSTAGRFDEAAQTLQSALALQPQSAPVLIALALVEAARWQTSVAARYVEQALSADFAVRSVSKFRLVRALVRAQQSKFAEAIDEMVALLASADFNFYSLTNTSSSSLALGGGGDAVMMDPAFQREQQLQQQQQQANNLASDIDGGNSSDMLRLTLDDKVLAFVSMASLLSHERRMKEARQVLAHAKMLFAGLNQEVVVLVAAARLYVDKGDFDAAVRMLDKISPDTTAFVQAQLVKADILLQHNHDKEGYARCFQLLVDRQRSPANLSLLAEAFLRILNPEKAVDVFEEAFKLDPRNTRLRARIGRTLVSTHEYHRAVEFYESAVRQILSKLAQQANNQYTGGSSNSSNSFSGVGTNNNMQSSNANQHHSQHQQQQQQLLLASEDFGLVLDLAALYRRLNRHESAARVLNDLLLPQYEPFLRVKHRVQALLQLSIVQQQLSSDAALQQTSLLRAHALQREHVSGLRNASVSLVAAQKERIEEERTFLAAICCQLGVALLAEGELSEAERYYDEALRADAQCLAAMLGLAQVALRRSEYDKCAQQCAKVLTAAPTHRDAAILHAETLLRLHDNDPEPAVKPLVAYLELIPADYLALDKAIGLLRRAGQLPDALRLLKEAEQHDKRFVAHPGYHYCSGLYARFTNDIGKAIASFNLARRDSLFAAFSLAHMIELYLNPDQEGIWEEKDTGPVDEETRQHIAAAEELLRELKLVAGSEDMRVRVLEGYCLLSTRNKVAVDKAMQTFAELLDVNQEYLPAVLGMATGFMIEKNQHKARNLLKRIGKMEVSKHDGEDFEKANLLLAKFYIDKGSLDKAQEVCRKALMQNKSCAQAWEILGLVFEKESNYELAADAYGKAWTLEFEASASVGFKLAFSLLKCRRFVETVDVCETVLRLYPEYPRIKEEILAKALMCMRTVNPPLV